MASSLDKDNMDLKAESTDGNCLLETEYSKSDPEGDRARKYSGRNKRILYDREFLIKCFHNPASTRKPSGFPIPHLDCTLGASKVKRVPFTTPQSTMAPALVPQKLKEDGPKRGRENEDNISLRPHSGNFSGGCGPNLTSPSHMTTNSTYSRIHSHEESSKGYDSRDFHRNNFRYGNHRRDMNDRNRLDRDRDRDMDRDHRDRMNRDRMSGSSHRNSNSWSDDNSDWSRRRNGAHFPRDRDYTVNSNKRYSNDRGKDFDEQEPEWFSGGPSSQHETIELRGFQDDDRREKAEDQRQNGVAKQKEDQNGEVDSSGESTKNDNNACESPMDLSIERILKMDHIPGILSNDLLESEEPSGSSRFSQFFMRNSTTPDPGQGKANHGDSKDIFSNNNEDKSKAVLEMGELLRNMLIKKGAPSDPAPEPKPNKESAKPSPATKDDVDAFKKLVTPLLEKVLQGPANPKKPQSEPTGKSPNSEVDQQGGSVLDIFKQAPQHKPQQQPQPVLTPEEGARNNPLQDIFNNMMSTKSNLQQIDEKVPRMTPMQVLTLVTPEVQDLVMGLNISHWDAMQYANIAKHNRWTLKFVTEELIIARCSHHQLMLYAAVLNLVVHGRVTIPGAVVVGELPSYDHPALTCMPPNPISNVLPQPRPMPPISPNMPMPLPQRPPNFMQRPMEEGPKDMTKRSGTPVSSMAFTPTSVMRKMTADGSKPMPPPNASGFIPVSTTGGLLPTPLTSASVIMNSNNPNLSTMSAMGRPIPHPHMQFRPPPQPMGYPSNQAFHPGMMPPQAIHGTVMLPPYQNILPNHPPPPKYGYYKPGDA